MKVGITAYGMTARELLSMAVAADHAGFHSLWVGEHVVLPVDYRSPHPTEEDDGQPRRDRPVVDRETSLVDPLVSLAGIASSTRHIELGTGIYLLALRHPLLTARAALTLQDLADGRALLGVGLGWLKEEFEMLGVPFAERGTRFDEAVALLRKALDGGVFEHEGPRFSTGGRVQVSPEACRLPLVFGGNGERALERAARSADGWFASGVPTLEEFLRMRDRVEALRARFGRTGRFRYWVRVGTWDPEALERYERAGVDEVLVWGRTPYAVDEDLDVWPRGPVARSRARLAEVASTLGLDGSR